MTADFRLTTAFRDVHAVPSGMPNNNPNIESDETYAPTCIDGSGISRSLDGASGSPLGPFSPGDSSTNNNNVTEQLSDAVNRNDAPQDDQTCNIEIDISDLIFPEDCDSQALCDDDAAASELPLSPAGDTYLNHLFTHFQTVLDEEEPDKAPIATSADAVLFEDGFGGLSGGRVDSPAGFDVFAALDARCSDAPAQAAAVERQDHPSTTIDFDGQSTGMPLENHCSNIELQARLTEHQEVTFDLSGQPACTAAEPTSQPAEPGPAGGFQQQLPDPHQDPVLSYEYDATSSSPSSPTHCEQLMDIHQAFQHDAALSYDAATTPPGFPTDCEQPLDVQQALQQVANLTCSTASQAETCTQNNFSGKPALDLLGDASYALKGEASREMHSTLIELTNGVTSCNASVQTDEPPKAQQPLCTYCHSSAHHTLQCQRLIIDTLNFQTKPAQQPEPRHCICGKSKKASFCLVGEPKQAARWCKACKPAEAITVRHRRGNNRAVPTTCELPGETVEWGNPSSSTPKDSPSPNRKRKCACGTYQPSFGLLMDDDTCGQPQWCSICKPPEAVSYRGRKCSCGNSVAATYSIPGGLKTWCSRCPDVPPEAVSTPTISPKGIKSLGLCECQSEVPTWSLPKENFARWCGLCPGKPTEAVVMLKSPKKRCKATAVGFSELPREDSAQLAASSPSERQQEPRNEGEAAAEPGARQGSSNPGKELRKSSGDKGMEPAAEDDSGEDSTDWHADDCSGRGDYARGRKKTRYVKEMPSAEAIANFNWV